MLARLRAKLLEHSLSANVIEQDVSRLQVEPIYELVLIPFHSFAELVTESDRRSTLDAVFRALIPGGRFVCTLHNPAVRLKAVGSGPTTVVRVPDETGTGELRITADLKLDAGGSRVRGSQTVEHVDSDGRTTLERTLPIEFANIERSEFEEMALRAGFEVDALYGDYKRSSFLPESSPYMVWVLSRPSSMDCPVA
jgi:hypothetical protein